MVSDTEAKLGKVAHTGFEKAIAFQLNTLHEDRSDLNRQVMAIEELKASVQKKLDILTGDFAHINKTLAVEKQDLNRVDGVLKEVEGVFLSIMEASQSLLHSTKSLGTKLGSKYPGRDVTSDDTLNEIHKMQQSRISNGEKDHEAAVCVEDVRPVVVQSPVHKEYNAPEIEALRDAGFAPPNAGTI